MAGSYIHCPQPEAGDALSTDSILSDEVTMAQMSLRWSKVLGDAIFDRPGNGHDWKGPACRQGDWQLGECTFSPRKQGARGVTGRSRPPVASKVI